MQIHVNGLELCPKFGELGDGYPLEIMLSQIMSFVHLCAKGMMHSAWT